MLNYKLKIGLLPIRRNIKEPPKRIGIFQSDYAVENKNNAIKNTSATTADFLLKNAFLKSLEGLSIPLSIANVSFLNARLNHPNIRFI